MIIGLNDLINDYTKIAIDYSEPFVSYRETVTSKSSKIIDIKLSNEKTLFTCTA